MRDTGRTKAQHAAAKLAVQRSSACARPKCPPSGAVTAATASVGHRRQQYPPCQMSHMARTSCRRSSSHAATATLPGIQVVRNAGRPTRGKPRGQGPCLYRTTMRVLRICRRRRPMASPLAFTRHSSLRSMCRAMTTTFALWEPDWPSSKRPSTANA